MLNVAFVSSEISPYASTGGLAEVCGYLPSALMEEGILVTQFMPLYRSVLEGGFAIEDTGIRLAIPVGFHRYQADIWRTREQPNRPVIYFIRRDEFFDRTHLYSLPDRDYDDNFERFIFFQKAVTSLINHLGHPFDVVHAHDWQTGLLPLYLRYGMSGEGRSAREKVIFTIHNLSFQGIFGGDYYSYTNLPFSCFSVETLEYYGNVNCLKGAVNSADMVTTVSATYAREIQMEAWGHGLHGVFKDASAKLRGICNGIDTVAWDPASDPALAANYDVRHLHGKSTCKNDIIRRARLRIKDKDPLLGMVTRLTPLKGMQLVDEILPFIMAETKAGLIILGSGTEEELAGIHDWAARWPGRVAVRCGFDLKLAHRIIAGADIYLMPSQHEPCGLNQLYSMRYGTVPVVHKVGGLADTVTNCREQPDQVNGYVFQEFTAASFQDALMKALMDFRHPQRWQALQQHGMTGDYSWRNVARQYVEVYRKLVGHTS